MKKTVKILATAIIILLGTLNLVAENKISDTSVFVLNGVISNFQRSIKPNAKCKVQIFEENKLFDSIVVRPQQAFEIIVKKNVWYTIKITNENAIPIMISIDTRTGNCKIKDNTFFFEVELCSNKKLIEMNKEVAEFPLGYASFNSVTGAIELRKNYSKFYYSNLYKVSEKQNSSREEVLAIKGN